MIDARGIQLTRESEMMHLMRGTHPCFLLDLSALLFLSLACRPMSRPNCTYFQYDSFSNDGTISISVPMNLCIHFIQSVCMMMDDTFFSVSHLTPILVHLHWHLTTSSFTLLSFFDGQSMHSCSSQKGACTHEEIWDRH